jgi:hypothetical protein
MVSGKGDINCDVGGENRSSIVLYSYALCLAVETRKLILLILGTFCRVFHLDLAIYYHLSTSFSYYTTPYRFE